MPSARPHKCAAALQRAWMLTFDIPQGKVSIAGRFWGEGEEEVMSRLGLISVHHTNSVNQLKRINQKKAQIKKAQILKVINNICKLLTPDKSLLVTPHFPLSDVKLAGLFFFSAALFIIWLLWRLLRLMQWGKGKRLRQ